MYGLCWKFWLSPNASSTTTQAEKEGPLLLVWVSSTDIASGGG